MSLLVRVGTPANRFPPQDKSTPGKRLQMRERRQLGDNWCWAASVESFAASLDVQSDLAQGDVVFDFKPCPPRIGCQGENPATECDVTIDRDELEDLWHQEHFTTVRHELRPLSPEEIEQEIRANRVIQVELGNRHVIFIRGWRRVADGAMILRITDTHKSGKSRVPLAGLDEYNGWGPWETTCVGFPVLPVV